MRSWCIVKIQVARNDEAETPHRNESSFEESQAVPESLAPQRGKFNRSRNRRFDRFDTYHALKNRKQEADQEKEHPQTLIRCEAVVTPHQLAEGLAATCSYGHQHGIKALFGYGEFVFFQRRNVTPNGLTDVCHRLFLGLPLAQTTGQAWALGYPIAILSTINNHLSHDSLPLWPPMTSRHNTCSPRDVNLS